MKHLFITYKTGIPSLAKEHGFNEPCLAISTERMELYGIQLPSYAKSSELFQSCKNSNLGDGTFASPMYQQIVDWFRETHQIEINAPIRKEKDLGVFYGSFIKEDSKEFGKSYGSNFTDYYEAYNAGILAAFQLLIDKRKAH